MKLKLLTAVSDPNNPGLHKLQSSLQSLGYDHHVIFNNKVDWGWGGWDAVYQWLISPQANDYTHIMFTDGFDTLALAPPNETMDSISHVLSPNSDAFVYSVEKHWFPHESGWEAHYHKFNEKIESFIKPEQRWRYVNGGQFTGTIQSVKSWYESSPKHKNNQAWANEFYAYDTTNRMILDFDCRIFQTMSHSGVNHGSMDEFEVKDKRLFNKLTGTRPCFVHNNGIKNPIEAEFMYNIIL